MSNETRNMSVCEHCGAKLGDEYQILIQSHGYLKCPTCERLGCPECMPAGRGCQCPECEGS